MQSKERNTAVEILRIASMFFVVLLHFNLHGINSCVEDFSGHLTLESTFCHFFESIAIIAVDVFVLISGYFGIRFKTKSLLRLFLMCFCWGTISYLLYGTMCHQHIGKKAGGLLFAFTHDHWWFIIAYLYLYFASPLLNFAIDHLNKKQFILILLLYSISALYFGFFRGVGDNKMGYSFAQFIYLYIIGRFINRFISIEKMSKNRRRVLLLWACFSGITFLLALLNQGWLHSRVTFLRPYTYNSPFVMGAAICLLCFSLSYSITNKTINYLSGSVLPAYLLQDSMYWGYHWLYPTVFLFLSSFSTSMKFLFLILLSISFLFAVVVVDLALRRIVYKPILHFYERTIMPLEKRTINTISRVIEHTISD